jgi:hypothetical protein
MFPPCTRIVRSKLRYIELELFGDFNYYLWGTFEFYMAIGIWLFALWIRIYVHYLAQYLYLVVRSSADGVWCCGLLLLAVCTWILLQRHILCYHPALLFSTRVRLACLVGK